MPKYLIERELPGAGMLTAEQLTGIAQRSCNVLRDLGPSVQWVQSYVTDDKIYCIAPHETSVLVHARRAGFPADRVVRVADMIEPSTAELAAAP